MDNDDIRRLLFQGDIQGSHTIAGWEVRRRGQVARRYDLMVSIHEALHDQLHGNTGYGGLLHVVAYLQRNGERQVSSHLPGLIDRCRKTHEAYATYLSLLITGSGTPDLALLGDNAEYRAYADLAARIAGDLRGGFLRYQAVAAALRACLQTDLVDVVAAAGIASFSLSHFPKDRFPDGILERVLSIRWDWLSVVERCRAEAPSHPGWDEVLRSEDEPDVFLALTQRANDPLADALIVAFHDEVKRKVPGLVGFNDHRITLPALLEQAYRIVPPGSARRRIHIAPSEEVSETDLIASFAEERGYLREAPLPLHVHPLPSSAAELVCGRDGLEHLYLVAQPIHRTRAQYAVQGELPQEPIVTGLQRVVVGADGARIAHFVPLPSAEALRELLGQLHEGHPVIACVSLMAYADAAWCKAWLGPLRGATLLTVLVDNDPFRHLDIWARQEGLVMRYAAMQLPHGAPLHSVVAFRPDGSPELFLVPCSVSMNSALATALEEHLPDGHQILHDNRILESADRGALSILLGHLLGESWFVDFRCAEGFTIDREVR